jgi:hypothetical protein
MSGICFYQEFSDKAKRRSAGTIVAALVCNGSYWSSGNICYEAIAGLFDRPNSPVAGTGVARDYLRQKCKRINEAKARTIHPALFERLDQPQI